MYLPFVNFINSFFTLQEIWKLLCWNRAQILSRQLQSTTSTTGSRRVPKWSWDHRGRRSHSRRGSSSQSSSTWGWGSCRRDGRSWRGWWRRWLDETVFVLIFVLFWVCGPRLFYEKQSQDCAQLKLAFVTKLGHVSDTRFNTFHIDLERRYLTWGQVGGIWV